MNTRLHPSRFIAALILCTALILQPRTHGDPCCGDFGSLPATTCAAYPMVVSWSAGGSGAVYAVFGENPEPEPVSGSFSYHVKITAPTGEEFTIASGSGIIDPLEGVYIRFDAGAGIEVSRSENSGGMSGFVTLLPGWSIDVSSTAHASAGPDYPVIGQANAFCGYIPHCADLIYSTATMPEAEGGASASVTIPLKPCTAPDPNGNDENPTFLEDEATFGTSFGTGPGGESGGGGGEGEGLAGGGGGSSDGGGLLSISRADLTAGAPLTVAYRPSVTEERIPPEQSLDLRQVKSASGLTAVWREVNPITTAPDIMVWARYPAPAVGSLVSGDYRVTGLPSAVWKIVPLGETSGTGSMEVIEYRVNEGETPSGAVVPGANTLPAMHAVSYIRYAQTKNGTSDQTMIITRGTIGASGVRQVENIRAINATFDGATKGIADTNAQGQIVSAYGISGDAGYPTAMVRGSGLERIEEQYFYADVPVTDINEVTIYGIKKLLLKCRSDGYWERYVYPDGLTESKKITIRPYGDQGIGNELAELNPTSSTMLTDTNIRCVVITETPTLYEETAPDASNVRRVVRREVKSKGPGDGESVEKETTTISQGGGRPDVVTSRQVFKPETPWAGRLWSETEMDGRTKIYFYDFTHEGEELLHTTETSYEMFPGTSGLASRAGLSHKIERVTDAQGNLTDEIVNLCTGEGNPITYQQISATKHFYDDAGYLLSTERDGREIYSATWVDGRKTSETDEFGQITTYADFMVNGEPRTITRAGVPVAGDLPAIPAQTVTRQFDVANRMTHETTAGGGVSEATVTDYDSAGRIKSQTSRGITVTSAYPDDATDFEEGGTVVKTFPGNITETTTRYRDGRIKAVVRTEGQTDVDKTAYTYSVTSEGFRVEKVTRGTGTDTVWTQTTRNLAGFVIKEESAGYNNGVVATHYIYNEKGQLASRGRGGVPLANAVYSVTTGPTGTSEIRTQISQLYFQSAMYGWWQNVRREFEVVEGSEIYRVADTDQGTTKEKIGGFTGDQVSKTIVLSPGGQQETTTTTLDRGTGTSTTTVTRTGATNQAVTISRLGLAQSVTGFSGGAPAITAYDGLRRVTLHTDSLDVETVTLYHTTFGQPESVVGNGKNVQRTFYTTGKNAGRLQSQSTNGQMIYYDYDATGRLTHQWGAATYPVRFDYDTAGRLRKLHTYGKTVTEPRDGSFGTDEIWPGSDGHVTTWNYVPGSRLLREKVDATGQAVGYTYNNQGLPATRTKSWALPTIYSYWSTGQLAKVDYGDATPDVTYLYDTQRRLSTLFDAAGSHSFLYTPNGDLDSETISGIGILTGSTIDPSYDPTHGKINSLTAQLDSTSGTQGFGYDSASGRLDTITGSGLTAIYSYRPNTNQVETTTIKSSTDVELLTHTRTYEGSDRLKSVSASRNGSVIEKYTWGYDTAGRRDTATIAGGERNGDWWDYSYNDRGEVTGGVRKNAAGQALPGYEFGYSFDAIGNRVEAWREATSSSAYTANALNQYESRTVPGEVRVQGQAQPGTPWVRLEVAEESAAPVAVGEGGLFALKAPVNNGTEPQYPELSIEAVQPGGGSAPDWWQVQTGRQFVAETPEVFTHDLDGNLTSDGRWTYEWDAENRLIGMETQPAAATAGVPKMRLEFAYDAHHRRIRKVVKKDWAGTGYTHLEERKFLYDEGWNLLAESSKIDTVPNESVTYLWGLDLSGTRCGAGGIGGLLAETRIRNDDLVPATYLPCYDGNGNIVRLVSMEASGADTMYEYGPFGELLRITGPAMARNAFTWSTKYLDLETGLRYYGYRYLGDGGWLSRDPLGELMFEPNQNFYSPNISRKPKWHPKDISHLYRYVENSPTTSIDKVGLETVSVSVVTEILPPDMEAGIKTWHVVTVNDHGNMVGSPAHFVGTTDIVGIQVQEGTGTFRQNVGGINPEITVNLSGSSRSIAMPVGSEIDYSITVKLDFCSRRGGVSGAHDGYPSYKVTVRGRLVYSFRQTSVSTLWGAMDVKIPTGSEFHF